LIQLDGWQLFGCTATRAARCEIRTYDNVADLAWGNFFGFTGLGFTIMN